VRWLFGLHGGTVWLWLSLVVLAADQYSKHWIVEHLYYTEEIVLHPLLTVTRLHNRGAAFSFLADASGWQHWLFVGLGVSVSIGILLWLRRLRRQPWLAAALALLLGGALGNVIDRVRFGYVVDFILVHYEQWSWPAFNVADSALTVGAVMLVIESFLTRRREENARP
jgi:signal peptidase II